MMCTGPQPPHITGPRPPLEPPPTQLACQRGVHDDNAEHDQDGIADHGHYGVAENDQDDIADHGNYGVAEHEQDVIEDHGKYVIAEHVTFAPVWGGGGTHTRANVVQEPGIYARQIIIKPSTVPRLSLEPPPTHLYDVAHKCFYAKSVGWYINRNGRPMYRGVKRRGKTRAGSYESSTNTCTTNPNVNKMRRDAHMLTTHA